MGLILKRNIESSTLLGLWKISESVDDLLSLAKLSESEKRTFQTFKAESRKAEWLTVRILVNELIGEFAAISYSENGRPLINCRGYRYISITHTKNMVGVLLSEKKEVGIDAELVSSRIERVVNKFMSDEEIVNVGDAQRNINYYIHWCAKEVITKLTDCKTYDFAKELLLENYQLQTEGTLNATIIKQDEKKSYLISYLILDEYVVTWSH